MNSVKIKTLQLFKSLEDNCEQSQRELSSNLDISLGSVNQLLKEVLSKGYLKVSSNNRKKATYSITAKGMDKKSKLISEHTKNSIKHYDYLKSKIGRLIEHLVLTDRKRVVLYGANELAEIVCMILKEYNLKLVGIIDDQQAGNKVAGETVREISFLHEKSFDKLIITLMEIPESLIDFLIERGVSLQKMQGIREAFDMHVPYGCSRTTMDRR